MHPSVVRSARPRVLQEAWRGPADLPLVEAGTGVEVRVPRGSHKVLQAPN